MPTSVIIILMVSSCTLLLVLLFVVRKREQKKKATLNARPQATQDSQPNPVMPPSESLEELGGLDLSGLNDLSSDPNAISHTTQVFDASLETIPAEKVGELVELVNRYQFFQGENLMLFERMLSENDIEGIEHIIREKFIAQGKNDAPERAQEVTKKLLGSLLAV